jgi:hypothetical protein
MHYCVFNALYTVLFDNIRLLKKYGLCCAPGDVMHRRLFGVEIGGVPWKVGRHCLYLHGADGGTRLGVVVAMMSGMDDMEEPFVLFQVDNKPIAANMGHYLLFSTDTHTTEFVLWTRVTWLCKVLEVQGGLAHMALPIASCTSREVADFD